MSYNRFFFSDRGCNQSAGLREEFSLMTEGLANQMDWRESVVEDTISEIILLLGDDGG
jgi:hypothetical protein